ncbi:MAG: TatD family hydrolase [bacterium]|nr:TatD family hydrolase [bacterium]
MIDSHCHLNMPPLNRDISGVLARAQKRRVHQVIVPAYDSKSWSEVQQLVCREGLFGALGIHPWVADGLNCEKLKIDLAAAVSLGRKNIVAIGEIGLDTKVKSPDLSCQLSILEAQLELAVDLDLPVILHCRGAFHELFTALNRFDGAVRGVIHAFTRGPELVQRFHAAGLYFGLGGGITRESARQVHRSARVIPLDKILLETDAPSIGLQGVRPEEAEPGHVAQIAEVLANLRDVSVQDIDDSTTENTRRLFSLPG